MTKVSCEIPERYVNPLFEVFDGGDFILSSYRDIEKPLTEMRIYFEDANETEAAKKALSDALAIVGVEAELATEDVPEDDWKFAYRRHFKTEQVSPRIFTVPEWEAEEFFKSGKAKDGQIAIVSDPGMAFGTGKHETTKACLQFIDEVASGLQGDGAKGSFLDMGCGSGILSIAAAKLGFGPVEGFDVDQEAVDASEENSEKNGVKVRYYRFALGRVPSSSSPEPSCPPAQKPSGSYDFVVANILGPLLIRFADEISPTVGKRLVISGILTELYPEVLAAYVAHGFKEIGRKTIGEWTTGLLSR